MSKVLKKTAQFLSEGSPGLEDSELLTSIEQMQQAVNVIRNFPEYQIAARCLYLDIHHLNQIAWERKLLTV